MRPHNDFIRSAFCHELNRPVGEGHTSPLVYEVYKHLVCKVQALLRFEDIFYFPEKRRQVILFTRLWNYILARVPIFVVILNHPSHRLSFLCSRTNTKYEYYNYTIVTKFTERMVYKESLNMVNFPFWSKIYFYF